MFTKNVQNELIKNAQAKKELVKTNDPITEANRLIEFGNRRDLEIFRKMTPNSTMQRAENQLGAIIDLEKDEDFHGGNIFTHAEVIRLAKKYRLKFLSSTLYIGDLDRTIPLEIKSLEENITKSQIRERAKRENITIEEYKEKYPGYKYTLDASDFQNKFFILAPPECFILKTEKIAQKTVYTDPILFYKTFEGRYRLIIKWGNDFTIFRRLLGIIYKNNTSYKFTYFTLPGILICALASILLAKYAPAHSWLIPLAVGAFVLPSIQWADKFKPEAFTDGGWCESDKHYVAGTEIKYKTRS